MKPVPSTNRIHSDAQVSPMAILGKNNVICKGAIIHANVILGDNNYIGPYVVLGEPGEYRHAPVIENVAWECDGSTTVFLRAEGKVIIGNRNRLSEFVNVQLPVLTDCTRIGSDCYIMAKTHVAHDCTLGDYVTIAPGTVLGGRVRIQDRANLGINASIHPRIEVGTGAMIGMGAVITKPVYPWTKVVSVNKVLGWNMRGMDKAGWTPEEIQVFVTANKTYIPCAE
jgi:UDP-N-acetylglucosamine acyltransferase